MKVSAKDVAYVADLANLQLSASEQSGMQRDLSSILEYIDLLNELDTSNVEQMPQISQIVLAGGSNLKAQAADREDVLHGLRQSLPQAVALANAPDADAQFFRVPKVIER